MKNALQGGAEQVIINQYSGNFYWRSYISEYAA